MKTATIVMLCMLCSLISQSEADLSEGLVLYLPFNGDAKDASGNGHDGEIDGAQSVDGHFGKALEFDGSDNFVEIPYTEDFNITEGITLGAWVTANVPFDPQWRGIINAKKSTYGPYLLQTGGAAKAEIGLYLGGAWTWLRTASSLERDVFHHVVGVYDLDSGLHIYFDGQLDDGEGSAGAKPNAIDENTDEGVTVGHFYNLAGRWWDGIIDEVVIYNRALTEDEVNELFQQELALTLSVEPTGKLATTWGKIKHR